MPLNKNIKKVLVIGSGPIVIGQAAEFDYAGTQACRALREDGIEIVLVNSNPATIMTDNIMADKVYIEPLTLTTIKRIIEKEQPDSILSGLGGQTGLTLCMQLAKDGFLASHNIRLLGAGPSTIDKAEDRQLFKDTMEEIGQPCVPSVVVTHTQGALNFALEIGYPVIVRPAFTLGGSGGGIAHGEEDLLEIAQNGLHLSPIHQILVEKCISGWKEIEFEIMRDGAGNAVAVCSMENLDPVGVHTGDSIVIAPCVTLAGREYSMLRKAALDIVQALGVEGGCNCQFALHPTSFEYAVIEVNPRLSRSSALASKATGYPIAKVATKVAIGYTLDEIQNAVTGTTSAAFEPAIDYVAVKFPKWPFDKFVYAKRELGTQMKATGEVMAMADSFEAALMKAVRGAEIGLDTLRLPRLATRTDEEITAMLGNCTDERIFVVYEAIARGVAVDDIYAITQIDKWFLCKIKNLCDYEKEIQSGLNKEKYITGKQLGYPDSTLERISHGKVPCRMQPTYRMVDTCAAEFAAATPYFYATFATAESGGKNEAAELLAKSERRKSILVLGSGPIRIGQGIEFDYASVHCVHSLKKMGYEVAIINNNPETVSTDFDTADRLYFEPLTGEDVLHVLDVEKPQGVVVAFGGGTAIKLAALLAKKGVPIIGTSADGIDIAEDRERFEALLQSLNIKRPLGFGVRTAQEALLASAKISYPVLLRPSYVLGGQNMIIAFNDDDVQEYMEIILRQNQDNHVFVDQYMSGIEIEVDAICDGEDILIPGIMEHIERSGVHSGDSISVYPAIHMDDTFAQKVLHTTRQLCLASGALGLVNFQYIMIDDELYIIEMNPRASRTVPYLSKVSGVPMCELATKVSLGEKLAHLGYGTGLHKAPPYTAVKVPVFSFEKLIDVDTQLGPEMKSTGEVMGLGKNMEEALYKGLVAAGYQMLKSGGVFLTVRDTDKPEILDIAKKFEQLGFELFATSGTAAVLQKAGLAVKSVNKISEDPAQNSMTILENGQISYILSTSAKGRNPAMDDVKIRRRACQLGIPCLTSPDTANALVDSLMSRYSEINTELVDINNLRKQRQRLAFTKMQASGNDYIYINCFEQEVNSPECLSVYLSERHFGIGGDGVVMMYPCKEADAEMRMFNLDGSEGSICGNAIRCVAKYLHDNGIVSKQEMRIKTQSGIKNMRVYTRENLVYRAAVDMGPPIFSPSKIPVNLPGDKVINHPVQIGGQDFIITCLSVGNPHCVVFCQNIAMLNLQAIGPLFETNSMFPLRVNTEFVQVENERTLRMRVWERGSGETMACGSGACAAVVAAVQNGHCQENTDIRVLSAGGELDVCYSGKQVWLTGDVCTVFEGVVEI